MNSFEIAKAIRDLRPNRYEAADILSALLENLGFSDKEVTEALVAAYDVLDTYTGHEEVLSYEARAEQDTTRI